MGCHIREANVQINLTQQAITWTQWQSHLSTKTLDLFQYHTCIQIGINDYKSGVPHYIVNGQGSSKEREGKWPLKTDKLQSYHAVYQKYFTEWIDILLISAYQTIHAYIEISS